MVNSLLLIEANKKETQAKIKTKFHNARRKIHAKTRVTATKNAIELPYIYIYISQSILIFRIFHQFIVCHRHHQTFRY